MSNFGRALTICIHDNKQDVFSIFPIYNEKEDLKKFDMRIKKGKFYEIV